MGLFDWFSKTSTTQEVEQVEKRVEDFSNFKAVTDYIYEKSGIIDLDKRALTASRLQKHALSQGLYTTQELVDAMKNNIKFFQEILNIATVNETFFMRESKELEWLIKYIKESSKNLKILSMPSSSGEEVYSILLLMLENNIDLNRVEIKGYDINSEAVQNARLGIYDEHSLHKIYKKTKDKYFKKLDSGAYEIDDVIKSYTQFEQKNIFELPNENVKYDVILSRNMFIYFDDEKRKIALDIIVNALKPDGIYIKGHADYIKEHDELENIEYGIYKKRIL